MRTRPGLRARKPLIVTLTRAFVPGGVENSTAVACCRREQRGDRRALAGGYDHRAVGADGAHDHLEVLCERLHGRHVGGREALREAPSPSVDHGEPPDTRQTAQEPSEMGALPVELDVRTPPL